MRRILVTDDFERIGRRLIEELDSLRARVRVMNMQQPNATGVEFAKRDVMDINEARAATQEASIL